MTWPFGALERGKYRAIAADPAWKFKARTALQSQNWDSRRDVEKHYDVMSLDDIKALPVAELAHPGGCHLFLCTTGPMLKVAFEVIEEWGFRYSSVAFVWIKTKKSADQFSLVRLAESDLHVGLGLTTRKNAEFVLLGRRRSPKRVAKDVREVILAPRREHSRKPDEIFQRIERYCAGPYAELFRGRDVRPMWDQWNPKPHWSEEDGKDRDRSPKRHSPPAGKR